jgi:parvulin-like peptidyl-prolyl isomerase
VGDVDITRKRVERASVKLFPQDTPAKVERQALERLIDIEVLLFAARNQGLENDFQVKSKIAQKKQELTLAEMYHRGVVSDAEEVDPEEARQYFERHHIAQQRRLSRILARGPAAIDRVLARLRTDESFATVASELSDDGQTAQQGGDLGWKSRLDFQGHILRRLIFDAEPGAFIGPVQEPDGFSVFTVTDEREVPFEDMASAVVEAMQVQKRAIATFKFLEGLADRADIRERADTFNLLLGRLSEAGQEMPEFKKGEGQLVLLTLDDEQWTLNHFMTAMASERNQAEIRELDDLRFFARRLYALKVLLPRYAREMGIHETERVSKGIESARRQALIERIRQIEVLDTLDPSKEEIRAYYEAHRDIYVREERISILEILVDTREQADSLLAAIERGGDLDDLARRYSRRSTRIRRAGGRIQLLSPNKYGSMGWEAENAQVGEIVGPIKTAQGFNIFKVLKKIPGYQQSFEETWGRVRAHLLQDLTQERFNQLLVKLKGQYADHIQIYEDRLQKGT